MVTQPLAALAAEYDKGFVPEIGHAKQAHRRPVVGTRASDGSAQTGVEVVSISREDLLHI